MSSSMGDNSTKARRGIGGLELSPVLLPCGIYSASTITVDPMGDASQPTINRKASGLLMCRRGFDGRIAGPRAAPLGITPQHHWGLHHCVTTVVVVVLNELL